MTTPSLSPSTGAAIHQIFDESELSLKLTALGEVESQLDQLTRELTETQAKIPLWDRIVFFSDTPDEARVAALNQTLSETRARRDQLQGEVDETIEAIGERFAPIELWKRLDACARLAHEDLTVGGWFSRKVRRPDALLKELRALSQRIVALYTPDFDAVRMIEALSDEETCRALARPVSDIVFPDERLGYAPITHDDLVALVAGKLLDSGYFQLQAHIKRLDERHQSLNAERRQASDKVTLLDGLNPYHESEAEAQSHTLALKSNLTRQQQEETQEEAHRAMFAALEVYPPLNLHRQVGAVFGALQNLRVIKTNRINANGAVTVVHTVRARALLQAALQNLRRTFVRTFPGVPLPSLASRRAIQRSRQGGAASNSPRHQLLRDFTRSMDRQDGQSIIAQSLVHAASLHSLRTQQQVTNNQIGLLDRAAFWSNSAPELQLRRLKARQRLHQDAFDECWQQLMAAARLAGREQAPLLIRDLTASASLNLRAITTSSSPCRVSHHRDTTLTELGKLHEVFNWGYGLEGNRQTLMAQVAQRLKQGAVPTPTDFAFRRREHAEIVDLIAHRLVGTQFSDEFLRLNDATRAWHEATQDEEDARQKVSFWDWVNVFSETDAERDRAEARSRKNNLRAQITHDSQALNAAFDLALAAYPPAQLFCLIDGVSAAVRAIYAKLMTRTTTDSKGRTRTRTSCELFNKKPAVNAMNRWNQTLINTYGHLPDYHECLVHWVAF